MFEALMVPLFVPEDSFSPNGWALSHKRYVATQIEYGKSQSAAGAWGFSPCRSPDGQYREFGVPALAANGVGYGTGNSTGPVVTPHAIFLAMPYARSDALSLLRTLEQLPGAFGEMGFVDSICASNDDVSDTVLVLDQGMIMVALGNELGNQMFHETLSEHERNSLSEILEREVLKKP